MRHFSLIVLVFAIANWAYRYFSKAGATTTRDLIFIGVAVALALVVWVLARDPKDVSLLAKGQLKDALNKSIYERRLYEEGLKPDSLERGDMRAHGYWIACMDQAEVLFYMGAHQEALELLTPLPLDRLDANPRCKAMAFLLRCLCFLDPEEAQRFVEEHRQEVEKPDDGILVDRSELEMSYHVYRLLVEDDPTTQEYFRKQLELHPQSISYGENAFYLSIAAQLQGKQEQAEFFRECGEEKMPSLFFWDVELDP